MLLLQQEIQLVSPLCVMLFKLLCHNVVIVLQLHFSYEKLLLKNKLLFFLFLIKALQVGDTHQCHCCRFSGQLSKFGEK